MKNFGWITKIIFVVLLFLCITQGFAEVASPAGDLQVVGWVESISIFPANLKIKAKLDTGARNSSLNASDIEEFPGKETYHDQKHYFRMSERFCSHIVIQIHG